MALWRAGGLQDKKSIQDWENNSYSLKPDTSLKYELKKKMEA